MKGGKPHFAAELRSTAVSLKMADVLTDQEIAELIDEPKRVPADWRGRLAARAGKREDQHERGIEVTGDRGSVFRLIARQDRRFPHQFSAVLAYRRPGSNVLFRLRRYNGPHRHPNRLERTVVNGCHKHIATERYQLAGWSEEAYAESDKRYTDLAGALTALFGDCAFTEQPPPDETQLAMRFR